MPSRTRYRSFPLYTNSAVDHLVNPAAGVDHLISPEDAICDKYIGEVGQTIFQHINMLISGVCIEVTRCSHLFNASTMQRHLFTSRYNIANLDERFPPDLQTTSDPIFPVRHGPTFVEDETDVCGFSAVWSRQSYGSYLIRYIITPHAVSALYRGNPKYFIFSDKIEFEHQYNIDFAKESFAVGLVVSKEMQQEVRQITTPDDPPESLLMVNKVCNSS